MRHSEELGNLFAALARAQSELRGAVKDAANPFYKSKYADLASVWDACRDPLAKNELSIVQFPQAEGSKVTVVTRLGHASGQWIENELSAHAKDDSPQAVGSAITYLRRYSLQSVVGVAPEDDDGEAATDRNKPPAKRPAKQQADTIAEQHGMTTADKLPSPPTLSKDDTGAFDYDGHFLKALEKAGNANGNLNWCREYLFKNRDHFKETINSHYIRWYNAAIPAAADDDHERIEELDRFLEADKVYLKDADLVKIGVQLDKRKTVSA